MATTAPPPIGTAIVDQSDKPVNEPQSLRMTYDEYLQWSGSEGWSEWVAGEVTLFMPPKIVHVRLVSFLFTLLRSFALHRGLGEVHASPVEMRILDNTSSREPDILFVATEHLDRFTTDRLEGPADLVVEIISDDSVGRDRGDKFDEYERAGVGEYWIADPRPGRHRFDAWVRGDDGKFQAALPDADGRYVSTVLRGFWLRPDWLWQDPLLNETLLLDEILASMSNKR